MTTFTTCPVDKQPLSIEQYPMLNGVTLAEPVVKKPMVLNIDVLVGNDHYYDLVIDWIVRCNDYRVLVISVFGYLTAGSKQVDHSDNVSSREANTLLFTSANPRKSDLQRFWGIEDIGIRDTSPSADDETALQQFKETVSFQDKRYHVQFLWKDEYCDVPSNYALAKGRLKTSIKRLQQTPAVFEKCAATLQEQVAMGIIEEAPKVTDNRTHYIPHHCIVKPEKSTIKLRIVYNASARTSKHGNSLNDLMHRVLLS